MKSVWTRDRTVAMACVKIDDARANLDKHQDEVGWLTANLAPISPLSARNVQRPMPATQEPAARPPKPSKAVAKKPAKAKPKVLKKPKKAKPKAV